jgi:hypothetical protein
MADTECKCFTGRVSRLVNCLSTFYELVKVNISDAVTSIDRLESEGKIYRLHREIVQFELKERGYVISEWLCFIE